MQGVIAAGHPQTAAAGAEILSQGGNAVDAAVAATFASYVTEWMLVNIGGGGIAQVYNPATGQAVVYDFFSDMPGLGAEDEPMARSALDFRQILVDFGPAQQPFHIGRGSVATPGVVAGLGAMVEELGNLPFSQILAPAVGLAREGVVLSEIQAYIAGILTPIMTDTSEIAAIYAPTGRVAGAGQTLHFPALAKTLERLGQEGAALFYSGALAGEIIADQGRYGGLLTATDLSNYRVHRLEPIAIDYRGDVILLPPPSSIGGVLIAFALKLLATVSLSTMTHHSFDHVRLLAEVMRLARAARAEWENEWANDIKPAGSNDLERINDFLSDDTLQPYRQRLREALAGAGHIPDPELARGPANTTHITVADAAGMIVTITTSAGEGAGFVVAETGLMLNNMLGEIDLHPGGFHRLPPGQRLTSMMSPVLVLRQGRPVMALGSGGSNRLRSAILQVISNALDFGMSLAEAVDAPRVHFEDELLQLEGGIAVETADRLRAAGYQVNHWPARNMFFGGAHAVAHQADSSGSWVAVGDQRRGGSVVIV